VDREDAIETERLTLRPWTPGDLRAFHAIWGDPEVIWWGEAPDEATSAAVIEKVSRRCAPGAPLHGWRAIIERKSGSIVGNVMLQPASFSRGDVEVGWHLARAAWGKGYATEAARALLSYAFASAPLPRIVAAIHVDNARSRRVAHRLGLSRVGAVTHANMPHDLFALDRPEAGP
jgi:RimJ/RimL family protein N-acetyltransferase